MLSSACVTHLDCPATHYCFSYKLCQLFINSIDFQIGDQVKVIDKTGLKSNCEDGVIVGSRGEGVFDLHCVDGTAVDVPRNVLQWKDNFHYECGNSSADPGYCGPLQLCEESRDSVDGKCPGTSKNKTVGCRDLNPPFCKVVKESPELCAEPYHGPSVASNCCASCASFSGALPADQTTSSHYGVTTSEIHFFTTRGIAMSVASTSGLIVAGVIYSLVARRLRSFRRPGVLPVEELSAAPFNDAQDMEEAYARLTTPRGN